MTTRIVNVNLVNQLTSDALAAELGEDVTAQQLIEQLQGTDGEGFLPAGDAYTVVNARTGAEITGTNTLGLLDVRDGDTLHLRRVLTAA